MDWILEELEGINLGDERLNKRAKKILKNFSSAPEKSIPSSHNGWHETKATYRFMSHENVTFEKIMQTHRSATLKRISEHEMIFAMQDTTELDYAGQEQKNGRGPTNHESHRGLYVHPLLALTQTGLCLGVLDARIWHRESIGGREDYLKKPIEEKESFRWLEALREVNTLGGLYANKTFVMVADSESDIHEVLGEELKTNVHYVIRGHHNRKLLGTNQKLFETLDSQSSLGEIEFEFKERGKASFRKVKQAIKVKKIRIKPTANRGERVNLKPIEITAILAQEKEPKEGVEPLVWMLLTTMEIADLEDAMKIIQIYLLRWKIEVYFKVLKSGCKVEQLQLDGLERLSNCLALYMIVAWRIMYLIQLGRDCPEMNCEVFFEEEEWRTGYMVYHKKKAPKKPPTLNKMIQVVAGLGGYLGRKSDSEPGPKYLWIGLERIRNFVYALNIQKEVLKKHTYG